MSQILDTFAGGAAALDTHTGDSGQTWVNAGGFDNPNTVALDGLGNLVSSTDGNSHYIANSGLPAASDFFLEVKVAFNAGINSDSGAARAGVFALDSGASFFGGEARLLVSDQGSGYKVYADIYGYNTADFPGGTQHNCGAPDGAVHTLRMVVSNSRKTYALYYDDALLETVTLGSSPPALGYVGVQIGCRAGATTDMLMTQFGVDLAPAFWTRYVKASEA